MTLKLVSLSPRVLLAAGLFIGAAAAQAATGYTVTKDQEVLVSPGMSTAEVQVALGHPERNIHYRNEPGATFTYQVSGTQDNTLFDVDFDANGRVASAGERVEERN